jgi:MoaA/NifB/PqqE/SkfB family radical SAM enzyme
MCYKTGHFYLLLTSRKIFLDKQKPPPYTPPAEKQSLINSINDCGQLKEKSFGKVWKNSKIFTDLRDLSLYRGQVRAL